MSARKVRATVDFRADDTSSNRTVWKVWNGTVVSKNGNPVLDDQTGHPARYTCLITVDPRPTVPLYFLMTQSESKSSRRYRYGTFAEMVDAAEKWAARKFYSEPEVMS